MADITLASLLSCKFERELTDSWSLNFKVKKIFSIETINLWLEDKCLRVRNMQFQISQGQNTTSRV